MDAGVALDAWARASLRGEMKHFPAKQCHYGRLPWQNGAITNKCHGNCLRRQSSDNAKLHFRKVFPSKIVSPKMFLLQMNYEAEKKFSKIMV